MVKLSLKAIYGVQSYQYKYRVAGVADWIIAVHTKSHLLLPGLTSGTQYKFRVAGISTDTHRVYSDSVKSYIL
ncbi:MAG: fibronectin type III domain-containing protein [Arachidicoccus sp.]|nr:fibronectin type III domain-containing protein [Arachidicoccus sp.]